MKIVADTATLYGFLFGLFVCAGYGPLLFFFRCWYFCWC